MDVATIIRLTGIDGYQKGQMYYTQGRVYGLSVGKSMIKAQVAGSQKDAYRVKITHDGEEFLDAACSCPLGEKCKHVAATGIAALVEIRRKGEPSKETSGVWIKRGTRRDNILSRLSASQIKKIPPKLKKSAWMSALDRELSRTTHAAHRHELQLLMRITDESAYPWMTQQKCEMRIEFRPRVHDRFTRETSLSLVQWKDFHASYYGDHVAFRADLDPKAEEFLRAFGHDLAIDGVSRNAAWAGIPDTRTHAFWQTLQRHEHFGVPLFFECGKEYVPMSVSEEPLFFTLQMRDEGQDIALETRIKLGERDAKGEILFVGDMPIFGVLRQSETNILGEKTECITLHPVVGERPVLGRTARTIIPQSDIAHFEDKYLPRILRTFAIENISSRILLPERILPKMGVEVKKEGRAGIRVLLSWHYGEIHLELTDQRDVIREANTMPILRDRIREEEMLRAIETTLYDFREFWNTEELSELNNVPETKASGNPGALTNIREETMLIEMRAAEFMREILPQLEGNLDMIIIRDSDIPLFIQVDEAPKIEMAVREREGSETQDWFDLEMKISVAGAEVPFHEIFAALEGGKERIFLDDGRYVSLKTLEFERLKQLIIKARHLADPNRERFSLSRYQVGWWEELKKLGVVTMQTHAWEHAVESLARAGIGGVERALPPLSLGATLRPYQEEGYSWLRFLRVNNLGGVLADDMGLGKTIQSIALICASREHAESTHAEARVGSGKKHHARASEKNGHFLIIAPTSVVENWDAEFEGFAPTIRKIVFRRGARKHLYGELANADAVITSYALLRRDYEAFKDIIWDTIIIDEASFVKNHQSKCYMLIRGLRAKSRIALTGTPIENNLMEFWSLFSIVAPGLFSSPEDFRELYQKPIEREQSREDLRLLKAHVRPFLLRRKKEDVERDLPPKIEQTIFLDMDAKQRRCYDLHLQRERARVLNLLQEGGVRGHQFEILAALTRLRQLCLHPALVDDSYRRIPSVKIKALSEHADAITKESHKALVFSQFTSFLTFARAELDRQGWKYSYLDGSTRNRQEAIRRFTEEENTRFFLISLKAGGFGLNLTAADYCILLDPWWNPAVEAQAIDRAHRIGQTKPVMIYRFIVKNTIEEKVLKLQEKKRALFKNVLDEGGAFGSLITEEDIRGIFA